MSTRHLLNIGMGTVALLLAASVGVVFTSLGDKGNDNVRIDLATSQQGLVQDLSQQVKTLTHADNQMQVSQARKDLGATILTFDQNLTALVHGGTVTSAQGAEVSILPPKSSLVKNQLDSAAQLWIQTGMPLADLAAGDFSIFSSAGQSAAAGLNDSGAEMMEHLGQAATGIRSEAQARFAKGNMARWFALGMTFAFIGLGVARFKSSPAKNSKKPAPAPLKPDAPMAPMATQEAAPQEAPPAAQVWNSQPHKPFTSPVDFDNVNASVDQLSVDMNTIAGSTNKMQVAIDSVGHAMQGMLFSLNQMAQDTAEGYKVVRGANNAASFTHTTAGELAESALEMSRVVGRVTQLAMKTKQIAGQIEAEAVHTGTTGEAFTSVVATEVKGLAQQTSQATAGIEQTVSEILGTARQYEEAIGQIIKNISAINKVSENLGEMMLNPPAAGVAGTPLPAAAPMQLAPQPVAAPPVVAAAPPPAPVVEPVVAATPEPAPEPAPAPVAKAEPVPAAAAPVKPAAPEPIAEPVDTWGAPEKDIVGEEPTVAEVVEETAEAITETAAEPEPSGSTGNVFMLGGGPKKAQPKAAKPVAEEPKAEEPAPAPVEEKKEDDGGNIFMLNKPKKEPAEAPAEEPKAEVPEPAPAPAPEPVPEPAAEKKDEGDSNIFMLNKPKSAPAEPAAEAAPEPEAEEPVAVVEEEAVEEDDDSGTNIYNLKKPEKSAPPAKVPNAEKEPVTVPADDPEEKKDDGGGNIFMLNKPKG